MKKLITLLTIALTLGVAGVASAYTYPASYRAVYCYDGGSYWAGQKAAYPEYYAANNAYYEANYGANTPYCPVN